MKRIVLLTLSIILSTVALTGCGEADGSLYRKGQVLKAVKEVVPREKYELESIEPVPDTPVSTEIYTFKSKERDLHFTATNTRSEAFFNSGIYAKALRVNYTDDVHSLYTDRIEQTILDNGLTIDSIRITIDSYKDVDKIATVFEKADDIYKEELGFNSAQWVMDNPACRYIINTKGTIDPTSDICSIPINGSWDKAKLRDYLNYSYASKIKIGLIDDPTTPEEVLKQGHIPTIKNIIINGVNISEDGYNSALERNLTNNTDTMYYSGYCYPLGDYVIPLNPGLTDENYAPQMLEGILDALGNSYTIEYKKGKVSWMHNRKDYQINAKQDKDHHITEFTIQRNGAELDIPYVINDDWGSPINGTYLVGIRATDLAELFELDMEIDEASERIIFKERD